MNASLSSIGEHQRDTRLALMKRVAVTLFVVGGATSATGVVITQSTPLGKAVEAAMSAAFVALGLLLLAIPTRRRMIEAAMLTSIVVLSAAMAWLSPVGMLPFFYLWPIVFAAYFCSIRMLVAAFSLMTVGVAASVIANESIATKLDTFEGTVVSVGLMGALVALMQRREQRLQHELEIAAQTDPLTGLVNRRVLGPAFAHHLGAAAGAGGPLAFILFDLDHFKQFNDRHGHLEGDRALQRFAAVLRAEAGPRDIVARLGGEEFAIVQPDAGRGDALALAQRVSARLAGEQVDPRHRVSMSCGIATFEAGGGASVEALMRQADEALYAAKAAGRQRAAWWSAGGVRVAETAAQAAPSGEPTVIYGGGLRSSPHYD